MAENKLPAWFLQKLSNAGKKGGKRSLETMTPEQRVTRAKKAAARSAEVRKAKAVPKKQDGATPRNL